MKTAKRKLTILILLSLLIICSLACVLTACDNENKDSGNEHTPAVAVTGVTLNESAITLLQGKTFKLIANVQPSNATNKAVTYEVTVGGEYASVSADGTVTGLSMGVAVVTVTTQNGNFTASCGVAVIPLTATGVTLDKTSLVLDRDESYKLTATVQPEGAAGTVIFASDDPSVAKVEPNGTVTAVKAGETLIKAYVGTEITAECAVRVGYLVTVQTDGEGEVAYGKSYYYGGATNYLEATPAMGYMFEGWYENGALLSDETDYRYPVMCDAVITAKFVTDPKAPEKNAQGFYELRNNDNLVWATRYDSENYILLNDISTYIEFSGFKNFSGIFDGNGYTVSPLSTESGFFGELNGTVKNLTLKSIYCNSAKADAGMLAGKAYGATIENCHVHGSVTLRSMNGNYSAGGLVGYASDTVIKNCSANVTANISSSNHGSFGGLIGVSMGCRISFCSADINTEVTFNDTYQYLGGLIGKAYSSKDIVSDCYTTGSIKASIPNPGYNQNYMYVGGLIGYNSGTVERCYSAADISVTGGASIYSSGFAGICGYNGTVKDSLYCGNLQVYEEASECAYEIAPRNVQNCFVTEGAVDFEIKNAQTVTIENLTEDFFQNTLYFGEGWIYEESALPHFQ